jgi:hypothetical protein
MIINGLFFEKYIKLEFMLQLREGLKRKSFCDVATEQKIVLKSPVPIAVWVVIIGEGAHAQ